MISVGSRPKILSHPQKAGEFSLLLYRELTSCQNDKRKKTITLFWVTLFWVIRKILVLYNLIRPDGRWCWKTHTIVAQSRCRSQHVQNTTCPRQFWRSDLVLGGRCKGLGSVAVSTSTAITPHDTKLHTHNTQLHYNYTATTNNCDYSYNCITLTLHCTTLHYTVPLNHIPLHYITTTITTALHYSTYITLR